MMAQVRLCLLRLGDRRTMRIATWTVGLAVAVASAPAVLLEPWLRSFFGADNPVDAVLAAVFVPTIFGFAAACLVNRGAMVVAFAAAKRWRAIVLAAIQGSVRAVRPQSLSSCGPPGW